MEATPGPEPGAAVTEGLGGDAAAQEIALPQDEEFAEAPEQWREKFTSLLTHAKTLERDLRAMRATQEQAAPASDASLLEGLGAYATDEAGNVLTDPNTGLPQITTQPFVEQLLQGGTGMADRLAYDLWHAQRPDGQTYGQWILRSMGLDPARIQDYAQAPASPQVTGEVHPDELQHIGTHLHEAYKSLDKTGRDYVQGLLDNVQDAEAESFLKREAERLEGQKFQAEMRQQAEQQQRVETERFWQGVNEATNQAIQQANRDALANLSKQISSQVTFSADPTVNAVQSHAITSIIAAACDPDTRFAVQPLLEAVGAQFDGQVDSLIQSYERATKVYHVLKGAAENPRFAEHRNDMQMQKAKSEMAALQTRLMAKLAPVALKVAKSLTGANQSLREAEGEQLAAVRSRPVIGNGAMPNERTQNVPRNVEPFSVEFLRQMG